jgi:hypothetical protein
MHPSAAVVGTAKPMSIEALARIVGIACGNRCRSNIRLVLALREPVVSAHSVSRSEMMLAPTGRHYPGHQANQTVGNVAILIYLLKLGLEWWRERTIVATTGDYLFSYGKSDGEP